MKLLVSLLFAIGVSAEIGRPELVININNQHGSTMGALEPTIKWHSTGTVGDVQVEGGFDVTVENADNLYEMPFHLWGKAQKTVSGVSLSAQADASSANLNQLEVDLRASSAGTSLQIQGSLDVDNTVVEVGNVKLTQKLKGLGGSWTVAPRYNVKSSKSDLAVAYGIQDTVISIDAALDRQKIRVSQTIGDNQVSPSISTEGEVELEYRRNIGTGAVTAAIKPNSHIGVKWEDGPWVADFQAPMDGMTFTDGVKMNVRRRVDV